MFDAITADLIRSAPPLEGLNLDALPQQLTDAFATVVSARIRLRNGALDASQAELDDTMEFLSRLAAAHEAYVALLPDRENRAAAAFVAGSAHQARRLARVGDEAPSRLTVTAIGSEVSAALLFMIAEAYPDAAEAAKRITADADDANPMERALLTALKRLAEGRLDLILELSPPEPTPGAAPAERALEALLGLLFKGVDTLARELLNPSDWVASERAGAVFRRVKALCIEELPDTFADGREAYSVLSGPLHLANLLIAAERDLSAAALAHLQAPAGVDTGGWRRVLRPMSRGRPFLWRNHKAAIAEGFLETGTSAAVSFPTGGGKSTLAELKIAANLLQNRQVVFLAPTHALVGQTTRALQKTFRDVSIFGDIDEDVTLTSIVELPEVIVSTPEQCLMLLSMQPEVFANLGLIVFDECHLLHARKDDRSRRGLDAMLCVLNLTAAAPRADLLMMSAMMQNTAEMAGWVAALTGRTCLALDLTWKPTRQVRGCVVYDKTRLDQLGDELLRARLDRPSQAAVPVGVQARMTAQPLGFFGLRQTWSTNLRVDYALRPLIDTEVKLSTSKGSNWYLTPNGNQVSAAIAAGSVAAGMKTLVFVQSTVAAGSCVKGFADQVTPREVVFNEEEAAWRALIEEEMGGGEHCFLAVDPDGVVRTGAAPHHALLLREERDLHESLFKRQDGLDTLFATSTLAQGMNLPSEVVIICGDSRFDPKANKLERLEAHELLNAAGRAGRAGDGAQGFVLLAPSHVIAIDDANNTIGSDWTKLRGIFEQSDQCLVIDDPFEATLDQIHEGITQSGPAAYLLGRLPVLVTAGEPDPAAAMLNRSLVAYRRRIAGGDTWMAERVASAIAARPAVLPPETRWIERVSAATGVRSDLLEQLVVMIDAHLLDGSALDTIIFLLDFIRLSPARLMELMRPETLEGMFGDKYKKLPSDGERALQALDTIKRALPIWMAGESLNKLEKVLQENPKALGHCEKARHFALRVVPDLAFIAGLPARLILARHAAVDPETAPQMRTTLATLGAIVREGCDSPESLAARHLAGRAISRVAARRAFETIAENLSRGDPMEDFEVTRIRVDEAMLVAQFDDLDFTGL
jgi:hypothetical protein